MKKILIKSGKVFILAMLVTGLMQSNSWSEVKHHVFTNLLVSYVEKGKINFTQLCRDNRLQQYTKYLSVTNPESIANKDDRFAFWLNVYNAYSLEAICEEYPIDNINDLNFGGLIVSVLMKKSIWDRPFVVVNGQSYTLKAVDHEILRPQFKDPRIQFAIACGAVGCAPSRSEAYEGERLDEQLDEQASIFINDTRLNSFNKSKRRAELSPLFNWSKKDFGKDNRELLLYVAEYLPTDLRKSITSSPKPWKVKFKKYDLTLNDAKN